MAEPPKVPAFPGGPDPNAPVPRDAVDGVDLKTYARISAELAERKAPSAEVLRRFLLDEIRWIDIEKTWLLRVAVAGMQGDMTLGQELDAAYTEAQAALGPSDPTRSLEQYAALLARIESGQPPATVLAADGLSLADWARLQRAWTMRAVNDAGLAATLRALVEEAKAAPSSSK